MECITVMIDNFLCLPWPSYTCHHLWSPSYCPSSSTFTHFRINTDYQYHCENIKKAVPFIQYQYEIGRKKEVFTYFLFYLLTHIWLFKLNKIWSFAKKFLLTVCGHGCWPYCYLFAEIWSQHMEDLFILDYSFYFCQFPIVLQDF